MCELFAMSSLLPANVTISLEELARHGGETDSHKDGWGVAFFEDNSARIIKEASPASNSLLLAFIKSHPYQNRIVISHIRKATQGEISYRNSQPFCRELAGRTHVFVHNGSLAINKTRTGRFTPIGNTDSEYAFCHLMNLLAGIWPEDNEPPLKERYDVISGFASEMRKLGPANFIYSDGQYLFCHGHERTQRERKGIYPPGLHWLCRVCRVNQTGPAIKGIDMDINVANQKVVLFASVPLTSENWTPFVCGELLVAKDGQLVKP